MQHTSKSTLVPRKAHQVKRFTAQKTDDRPIVTIRSHRSHSNSSLAYLTPDEAIDLGADLIREATKAQPTIKGEPIEVRLARQTIEEARIALEFWQNLENHHHSDKNEELCDSENCYEAWHEYPDG